jgi:hypothetical protein
MNLITNENIKILIEENYKDNKNTNVTDLISNFNLINQMRRTRTSSFDDEITNYYNYSIKELILICDYYNLNDRKMKKQDIINNINYFENKSENEFFVKQRKRLWFYMETLKNDKFMKKYIIW